MLRSRTSTIFKNDDRDTDHILVKAQNKNTHTEPEIFGRHKRSKSRSKKIIGEKQSTKKKVMFDRNCHSFNKEKYETNSSG